MTQPDSISNGAAADTLREYAERPLSEKIPLTASLMVGVVAVAFESFAITVAMRTIFSTEELGHSGWYAWGFSLFLIGQGFATVVAGRLCDHSGAFRPLALGLSIFGTGLVVAATSQHALWFLAARLIQGFGGGLLTVTVMVVLAELYAGAQRANLMAIFAVCYMGPAFVGPILAGWMNEHIGWRFVFWVVVPFVFASAALGGRKMWALYGHYASRSSHKNPVPIWAAGLLAIGLTMLQAVSQYLVDKRAMAWWIVPVALAGVAFVSIAFPRLMPPKMWRLGRGLPAVIGVRSMMAGVFAVAQAFVVLVLQEQRGMTPSQAGIALTMGAVGYGIGVFFQGRTWMRIRRDQIILIGSLAAVIGMGSIAGYSWMSTDIYPLMLMGISFTALGMGFSVASTSLAVVTLSPADRIGRNTSSLQVADNLGCAVLVSIAGAIYAALHDQVSLEATFGWLFSAQLIFVGVAVWSALRIGPVRNESSGAD